MNKAQKQIIKEWRKGHNKYMEQKEKVSPTIPKSMFWKGKAKDFPGVQEVIKQNGSK